MAPGGIDAHFKIIAQFQPDYCPGRFTLYESQRTGLRVVTLDTKGPKLYGYLALATEIHDDSGAPHTLEHLIFMGSRKYKYKGFLDKLASRAYSNTNAWTATDQTVYTLETAGWDGFNQMLPVYLDHVLNPTLTDAGCYTEVFHVDGTGHDAGVVYSEIQGTENTQYDLMDLRRRRLIYPEGVGFRYETGGLMENLRVLSADRIRAFHRHMYQPKNLSVILIGDVNHQQLLKTLNTFEDDIVGHVPSYSDPFERPWTKGAVIPPFPQTVTDIVEFPEEDESRGELSLSYLGPPYEDLVGRTAVAVLLVYLAGSSIAALCNVLVEKEHLASSIWYEEEARSQLLVTFSVDGVATGSLEKVRKRFLEVLGDVASTLLNMSYLRECLQRHERQVRSMMERDPNSFHPSLINEHLFGSRDGSIIRNLGTLEEYKTLAQWSEPEWRNFLTKWFIDCHHVCLLAKPSVKLSERLEKEETERVEKQKASLGEAGLQRLAQKLQEAQLQNGREIPTELMESFKPPTTESIHFVRTSTALCGLARRGRSIAGSAQQWVDKDGFDPALFLHFESIQNSFVRINLVLCTHSVPEELRPLLQLYIANFYDAPVHKDGERVEYEQVQAQLENDTVMFMADIHPSRTELLTMRFVVEQAKYPVVIDWIEALLFDRILDAERLISTTKKLLADVPEEKRSGEDMADAVTDMLLLGRKSTPRAFNTLAKDHYLRKTLYQLEHTPEQVLAKMKQVNQIVSSPANIRFNVLANLEGEAALPRPASSFEKFSRRLSTSADHLHPIDNPRDGLSSTHPGDFAYVVPMRTLDSSFAVATAKGLDGLKDPRRPAYSVAAAYLDAVEGPMWSAIRGSGLAYGTYFSSSPNLGMLTLRIFRSPDVLKAFTTAKKTVESIVLGETAIDRLTFEGAISATVVKVVDQQPTMVDAADRAFTFDEIEGVGKDWPYEFMRSAKNVSETDMKDAMRDLLLPLFDPRSSSIVVTCSMTLEAQLLKGFREYGFAIESRSLNSFEDDYGLEGEFEESESESGEDGDEDSEGASDDSMGEDKSP